MISRIRACGVAALLACLSFNATAQLTVNDDIGRTLSMKGHAKRIVTLAPFLTEIAFAAGAGDLVVGADALSDYPEQALSLPKVKTGAAFSVDQLAPLAPDLVLAWQGGIRPEDVAKMETFGATVYISQARNLEDVPRLMRLVGTLTGRDEQARAAANAFESRMERIRRTNESKARMTAFVEIWSRPLTTVSGEHFLSEALDICRADNVFKERMQLAPQVSIEDVQAFNPYVIVGAASANSAQEFRSSWAIRPILAAVQAERLVYVDTDTIQRPTPRTLDGIEKLCAALDTVRPQPTRAEAPPLPAPAVAPPISASPAPPPAPASKRPSQFGM